MTSKFTEGTIFPYVEKIGILYSSPPAMREFEEKLPIPS